MAITFNQLTAFNAAAVSAGAPAGCRKALLQAEGTNVRYRLDGTDPTASVGGILVAGAAAPLELSAEAGLHAMKVIGVDGSSKLNIHFFTP